MDQKENKSERLNRLKKLLLDTELELVKAEKEVEETRIESKQKVLKAKEDYAKDKQQLILLENKLIGLTSISKLNSILLNNDINNIDVSDFI